MATSRYFAGKKASKPSFSENDLPIVVGKPEISARTSTKRRKLDEESTLCETAASAVLVKGTLSRVTALEEARAVRLSPQCLVPGAPFCAPPPAKYRCRVKSTCMDCFSASMNCEHYGDDPLDLLLLGHNPSSHVWLHGYNYGQPSNKMWRLLTGDFPQNGAFVGCLPSQCPIEAQHDLPSKLGIGFIEVAPVPGSDAAAFSDAFMRSWVPNLFARLRGHISRVRATRDPSYKGPRIVAFTGKRQLMMMFPTKAHEPKETIPFGCVPFRLLPREWPFPASTQVWVLTSSSGRAAMTNEQRADPYRRLAEEFHKLRE